MKVTQTDVAGEGALLLRQFAHQDRDEDDVIDAQYDFQGRKGAQRELRRLENLAPSNFVATSGRVRSSCASARVIACR